MPIDESSHPQVAEIEIEEKTCMKTLPFAIKKNCVISSNMNDEYTKILLIINKTLYFICIVAINIVRPFR